MSSNVQPRRVEQLRAAADAAKAQKRKTNGHAVWEPTVTDGADLLNLASEEVAMLCRKWVQPGVTINAGRPKIGKTSRARQKVVHVQNGIELWNEQVERADTMFLSLEEGAPLMGKKLRQAGYTAEQLHQVRFVFEWPRGLFGAAALREYLAANPTVRYVVIDSLTRFRDAPTKEKPQFMQDYEAVQALGDVAKERPGTSIELVHHTTKAVNGSDPIADISGTYGLSAAADNYEVLRKEGDAFVIHCGGRYWDETDDAFVLVRDGGRWQLAGAHDGITLTTMQREYLARITEQGTVTTRGLARDRSKAESTVSEVLRELASKGMVQRTGDGWQATEQGHRKVAGKPLPKYEKAKTPSVTEVAEGSECFGSFGVSGEVSRK